MAGPLSSEEIEDVVSSVRRLVSNEHQPRTLSRDLNAERLLLTPAQRVLSETSPLAPLAPLMLDSSLQTAEPMDADAAPGDPVPVPPPADSGSEGEAPAVPVYVAETSAGEAGAESGPLPVADPELAADLAEAASEEPDAGWEDEIWSETATVSLGEIALAAEEAEVLTGPDPDQEMPDRVGAGDQSEPRAPVDSALTDDGPIPFVPLRRRAEHLAAQFAAGEGTETPPAEAKSEAEVVSLADAAPAVPGAAKASPEDAEARAGYLSAEHLATEFVDADGMSLAVLDEHALQEIVRQTLRAELKGELGERITRNVRKLVRAEINRAFMARDLD